MRYSKPVVKISYIGLIYSSNQIRLVYTEPEEDEAYIYCNLLIQSCKNIHVQLSLFCIRADYFTFGSQSYDALSLPKTNLTKSRKFPIQICQAKHSNECSSWQVHSNGSVCCQVYNDDKDHEPMTSAIPVQCSTDWAMKRMMWSVYDKDHIWVILIMIKIITV